MFCALLDATRTLYAVAHAVDTGLCPWVDGLEFVGTAESWQTTEFAPITPCMINSALHHTVRLQLYR